jgi:hypothetical protein
MATYVNDLRLKEIATGDESGTWGTSTNTNLELIAEAFSFGTESITTNADTHTTTIADGSTDPGRSIYLQYTGTLDSTCTITIGPNTVSKLWFIENATSGSQSIIIKQGSGATVTIANGQVKAIYSDGAGSGGKMVDAFQDLSIPDLFIDDDLTFTSDSAVITFGADGDTTLTHTDGSGLTLNSTNKIMFNDASQFIQGSSATVLALGATDEIDLTATAIDVNGTMDVSGALTGTTATFTTSSQDEGITIVCTNGGASAGPSLKLDRNSSGPADNDSIGEIEFSGRNDADPAEVIQYARIFARADDVTNGEEDGELEIQTMFAGAAKSRVAFDRTATVFNEGGEDLNFRIESDSNDSMFVVNAASDRVHIGSSSAISVGSNMDFTIQGQDGGAGASIVRNADSSSAPSLQFGKSRGTANNATTVVQDGDTLGNISFRGADGTDLNTVGARIVAQVDGTPGSNAMPGRLIFSTNDSSGTVVNEVVRIDSSGNVGIGTSTPTVTTEISSATINDQLRVHRNISGDNTTMGAIAFSGDDSAGNVTDYGRINGFSESDNTGSEDGGLIFKTMLNASISEAMRINSSGNVGIGDSTDGYPATLLELSANNNGGAANNTLRFTDTDTTAAANQQIGKIEFKSNDASGDGALVRAFINCFSEDATPSAAISFATSPGGAGNTTNERMRIDSTGNLLVGTTDNSPVGNNVAGGIGLFPNGSGQFSRDGGTALLLNRKTSEGTIVDFRKDGSTVGNIGTKSSRIYIGTSDAGLAFSGSVDAVFPVDADDGAQRDNAIDLGLSSSRFDDIFATNGTIQTSDRNEKQDIEALSAAEQRVAVAAKGLMRKYRWKSKVAEKGDDARIHVGIIAQDLQDAFTAEGLDAARYALFCSDTWTNDDGSEQTRLGVRYSELLAFIISAI